MKRSLLALLTAALIGTSLMLPASAAQKSAEFKASKLTTAPKFDGVISENEYGSGDFISLTDSRLNPQTWVSGHAIDPDLSVKYKFAWDDENLYMAVEVKGDKSPSQTADETAAWFSKADCIQVFINPEYKVTSMSPVCFTIGFSEDKMPVVWRSKLGDGVIVTPECKGYSTKYADSGYIMEVAIPWSTVLVDTSAITTSDTKIAEGTQLGLSFVYADVGGVASYVKTDGNGWNGSDIGAAMLTLGAADKVTVKPTVAAQTPDLVGLSIAALIISAGAAYTVSKRR